MRKAILLGATAATLALLHSAPVGAKPREAKNDRRELGYFLPKTRVAATVQQQLRRCPTTDNKLPQVETTIDIAEKLGPDPAGFVLVDARGRFLTGRTTRLELRPNGTLSAFNATTQGEGGAVISAVIGAATTVLSAAVGVPGGGAVTAMHATQPESGLKCNAATWELVQRLQTVEAEIVKLQSKVAEGTNDSTAGLVLVNLKTELDDLKKRLTLTAPEPVLFDAAPYKPLRIKPIDYTPWFDQQSVEGQVVGTRGFRATLTPNKALLEILGKGDGSSLPTASTPYLFYRRPVPALVAVAPCASEWANDDCTIDIGPEAKATTAQKPVLLPQLSGMFRLPIGNSNLFGTRRAVATFDEQGAPLALEYGSTPGGAEIAGVINAGTAGFTTYRGAETAEINRRVANLKARKELQDLLDKKETE